ncbi:MAG: alpha/beta fold hydrolase [Candidatus Manganitrophus sp. SB1]|nr:alpha/beta fold hydrolase [Candidatus Manganitrophus morganii]
MDPLNRLHCLETGAGPPLLFIHGLFDLLETWERLTPLLSDQFKLCAIDLPGFGKSPLPEEWEESLSGMIEAVVAFLDSKGIEKTSIVGSSMGGGIALGVAGRHPERVDKIVLINPYGFPSPPVAAEVARSRILGTLLPYLLNKPVLKHCARALFSRSLNDPRLLTDTLVERVIAPFATLRRRKDLFRFLQGISTETMREIDALLPRIHQPVLILWGEKDRWLPIDHAHRLRQRLSNSQLTTLPDCGHLPQMDKPKEVAEAIRHFLLNDLSHP